MNFPTLCIDNFYQNPDAIRHYALSQDFKKNDDGKWPGKRTKLLHELNPVLFDQFCSKLFSIFFDFNTCGKVLWTVETSFQMIESMDECKDSIKNKGWIHLDGSSSIIAGVVYLTPDADLNTGTSVFRLKNKDTIDNTNAKINFYRDGIDDNYDELLKTHNSSFEETTRFNNVYNRMAMWDGNEWHGVNSFYSDGEPRLTQVFFVNKIELDGQPPLQRFNVNWNGKTN